MRTKLVEGLSWGHLRVTDSRKDFRTMQLAPGVRERRELTKYLLACDCGKEFWIWADDWEGKRKLKDCGCGLAVSDGALVNLCVSMPLKYMVLLKNYAIEHGIPQSRAVVELIKQAGLDEEVRSVAKK